MRKLKEQVKELYSRYRNFILYCLIGVLNTGLDVGVFTVLDSLGVHYIVANVVGYHCGILCSFFLNGLKNFQVKDRMWYRFASFYLSSLVAMALNTGLLWMFVSVLDLPHVVGKLLATAIVVVCQFLYVKNFTFKK